MVLAFPYPCHPGREDFLWKASFKQHLGDEEGHGLAEQGKEGIAAWV